MEKDNVTQPEPTAFAPKVEDYDDDTFVDPRSGATKQDIDELRDAIKELTTAMTKNMEENTKWFNAGRMGR